LSSLSSAIQYHEATKHTPASIRYTSRRLDWSTKPDPFKTYTKLPPIALPDASPDTGFPATAAISGAKGPARPLDAPELARILTLAAGIRKVLHLPNGEPVHFRTYACAGALYPIEVYLACAGIEGLEAGLYHYSPLEDALRQLRPGDPRPYLLRAAGGRESIAAAPASVLLSGIPWRTTWKYRQRGYRHLFWDSGMILANLLALSTSGGHSSEVVLGFDDGELNRLIGVDGHTEMAIALVPIGAEAGGGPAQMSIGPAEAIDHPSAKLSHWEREYEEIVQAHRLTGISGIDEAELWHQEPFVVGQPPPEFLSADGIEKVIRRRGSKRAFDRSFSIPLEELAGILEHASYKLDCDWGRQLTQVAVLAHSIDGLASGAYAFVYGFDPITNGELREKGQFLCLEQPLGGDGAATMFLFADLEEATGSLGNRGYRAAQLDAGITAGRLYLGAYACGFGATGLTFYDDEVRSFFETQAEPMLAVALGR
jgi:SagB-type dehydrogenase family enzyme